MTSILRDGRLPSNRRLRETRMPTANRHFSEAAAFRIFLRPQAHSGESAVTWRVLGSWTRHMSVARRRRSRAEGTSESCDSKVEKAPAVSSQPPGASVGSDPAAKVDAPKKAGSGLSAFKVCKKTQRPGSATDRLDCRCAYIPGWFLDSLQVAGTGSHAVRGAVGLS